MGGGLTGPDPLAAKRKRHAARGRGHLRGVTGRRWRRGEAAATCSAVPVERSPRKGAPEAQHDAGTCACAYMCVRTCVCVRVCASFLFKLVLLFYVAFFFLCIMG